MITTHHPVPRELLKIAVSDGSITIFVSGRMLKGSAVDRLCEELDFAASACHGIVTVDLDDCTELDAEAVHVLWARHNASHASESRYRLRIIGGRSWIVRILAAGGAPIVDDARLRTHSVPTPMHTGSWAPLRRR